MYQADQIENDPVRMNARKKLNRADRILFVVIFLFVIMLAAGITSLYINRKVPGIDSYGYDLANLSVPRDFVVSTGLGRYALVPLNNPETITGQQAEALQKDRRNKFVTSDDRVVGVIINSEARAYRVRELNWHEVINDELGGVPIAVTYSPLCDSVVVFDRRIDGETLILRHSGLIYTSNLVMQDEREVMDSSSLWSQLQMKAIAGPLQGRELRVLPMQFTTWRRWYKDHPDTTVARGLQEYRKRYNRNPYGHYFMTGEIKFPVKPLPPDAESDPSSLMDRILVLEDEDGSWKSEKMSVLGKGNDWGVIADNKGEFPTFTFEQGREKPAIYCCRFAWYAMHH
ncbi:MAG TPA: DUF3179 domain-containing protein [Phycisphaeraceae bacterium]|nr:DUF3179 domain-containing protein [Phycisphaeraceae bacterium]